MRCTGADFPPHADARRVDTAALLKAPAAASFDHWATAPETRLLF